ncbi:MAG: branched-chain amino acid ABC transporter permease [Clostridia bacterium]|nr:branched-chain amino acid ABC transporter permease [Clostridia bacterium]MBR3270761.1 branched-chain amino acid ABC transporter permease [Clostridia bacterium]
MDLSQYIVPLITGIASGLILYLSAAGMNLMISGLGVINFGQGAFFVLGAGVCLAVGTATDSLLLGLLAGTAVTFVLGGTLEFALRPVVGKKMELTLMITMGIAYILNDIFELMWGASVRTLSIPAWLRGLVKIGSVPIPKYYLFIIAASLLIALAFWIVFEKTKLGMQFRAIISNRDMVNALGINVKLTYMLMFMIGIALSGFAGALNLPISGFSSSGAMGAFGSIVPILVIGGLGNIQGTFPAAIFIGIVSALAALFAPKMYNLVPTIVMVLVIIFKPQGLFARKER